MAGRDGKMDVFHTLWASCVLALVLLFQPGAPGHAASAEAPCHEEHTAAAKHGQPCGDHAGASDMACCLAAGCAAPAWASPALAACPQPFRRPVPAAFARLRAGGDGLLLRPVLPPPRAA